MCGIAGRVNRAAPVDLAQLEAMGERCAHRGPDDAGAFLEGAVGLVHRRLAIVDRAGGKQPAYGEEGRVVLVYNGEVYNHEALRRELEARGHRFGTRADTEAILHAHEEHGVGAARRLRGMFAYAAWDRAERRLTLVRDHLGIKPLYYAHLPSGDLLFASELRALLVEPAVDRSLDEDALAAYLALRYVPAPATILRGVRKLQPGCALVWADGRLTHERWWRVPVGPVGPRPPTRAEAGGRLCGLLDEVVERCRMGEVPVGTLLSGGVDSTLVTAILARAARRDGLPPPCTFAVGYLGDGARGPDELAWARRAAAALGTRHREVAVSPAEIADALPRIAWDLDEPLADPSCAPLWFLARRARQEVTVVLSGEGADEVFAGYAAHARVVLAERLRARRGVAWTARLVARLLPPGRWRRAAALLATPMRQGYRGVARAVDDQERPPWGPADAAARALAPAWTHASTAPTTLAQLLAFDQQVWLPDDLLLKSDRMTMAHALELRPPLLDHLLVEEVAGWPDAWKLEAGRGKVLLRRAAEGLVPAELLARPKRGFPTPVAGWLRGALAPVARDLLTGPRSLARERGGVDVVRRFLQDHARGRDRADELWTILWLELWRREVAGAAAPAAPAAAPELTTPARVGEG